MTAILTARIMLDGGLRPLHVATEDYYSLASDSIGAQHFTARIIRTPVVEVAIGCAVWGRRSSTSVGQLVLADQDQTLDAIGMLGGQRDARVEMRLVRAGESYDAGVVVCLALIDAISRDEGNVILKLRGTDAWLERPVCNSIFTALSAGTSSTSTSDGLDPSEPTRNLCEVQELGGDPVPVVLGRCWQVEAPLVGATDPLAHQITDARVAALEAVLSGGAVATPGTEYVPAFRRAGWEWLVTPAARVLCNVDGFGALDDPVAFGAFADQAPSTDGYLGWQYGTGPEPVHRPGVGLDWTNGGEIIADCDVADGDGQMRYAAVLVDVAYLGSGAQIEVTGDYAVTITRPGRWARVLAVSGTVTLRMTGRVVLRSAGVYMVTAASSGTLTEMIRHLAIARAGIHTGESQIDALVDSDFAASSDFDKWSNATFGASASVTWSALIEAAILYVSAGADEGGASLTWPNVLPAGQYTLNVDALLEIGQMDTRVYTARVEAVPTDGGAPIGLLDLPIGSATRAVYVSVPVAWQLRVIVRARKNTVTLTLASIALTRRIIVPSSDEVDLYSASRIDSGATLGAVFRGRETVAQAIDYVLSAVCGYYYTTPAGPISFGRLEDAGGVSPRIDITSGRLLGWPTVLPDDAERLSDRWAAGRNQRAYDDADLAGITYPNRPPLTAQHRHVVTGASAARYASTYTHAIGAPPIETPIYSAEAAQAEADRVSALYTRERVFVTCDYLAEDEVEAATLRPGMYARLSADEFPDSVRDQVGLIVSTSHELRTLTVRVTCWVAVASEE
jgi:hypothetical protein